MRLASAFFLGRCGNNIGASQLIGAIEARICALEPNDEAAAIELAGTLGLKQAMPALECRALGFMRWFKERHVWTSRVVLVRLGVARTRQAIVSDLRA